MVEKTSIQIGDYIFECTDPEMTFRDFIDHLEELMMVEMKNSMAGDLLIRLFYFFDTATRPLSPIEFFEFWEDLDPFEQLPFLLFAENVLIPANKEN
ncbi:hypothetical protein SEA_LIBERTYBELL_62 [Streptomyces phage LibertyBell]|nr:hypothetical protein SEA_LIBERTYBELL_62 [Streptomyces phage LibertyBell]